VRIYPVNSRFVTACQHGLVRRRLTTEAARPTPPCIIATATAHATSPMIVDTNMQRSNSWRKLLSGVRRAATLPS
jgi:hypothetical protein